MMGYREMIDAERAAYERAPLSELRKVRLALSIGVWGNTTQENARLEAVEGMIHERLSRRIKEKAA
jgi:hypothetical protein